jgi:hypothetical protein
MARAPNSTARPSLIRPTGARKRQRQTSVQYDEQRPVLQLPLESPSWREPPSEPQGSDHGSERIEDRERGIAVIDFYI